MAEEGEDEEPRKLILLLGLATAVAGLLLFIFWPREHAVLGEATSGNVFEGPSTLGAVKPLPAVPPSGGIREAQEAVRVRSSDIELHDAESVLAQAAEQDPVLGPKVAAFRKAQQGQPVPPRKVLQALQGESAFGDFLRHAFADRGLAPVLAPLKDDKELAKAMEAKPVLAAAPTPEPEKPRVFRSETGMSVHGAEEGPAKPAMPGQRDAKANAVLASYPFLGQVFTPEQLSAMQPEVQEHGVWAACLKAKQFAACQGACAARGKPGECASDGWSACMGAFRDEKSCIKDCKGQAGCEVPPAVFQKNCASNQYGVPPSYCFGF